MGADQVGGGGGGGGGLRRVQSREKYTYSDNSQVSVSQWNDSRA